MNKYLSLLILFFIGLNSYAQKTFKKGFIITLNKNKINCLIENKDFYFDANLIYYKLSDESKEKTIPINLIKKLEIPDVLLLERHTVKIEKNDGNLSNISDVRYSNLTTESLLLKVIVEGKVRLLKYNFGKTNYFFYVLDNKINLLEYKVYKNKNEKILKNLNYKKNLRENLKCSNSNLNSNISYTEKSLIKYFKSFNNCNNSKSKIYKSSIRSGKIFVRVKTGVAFSKAKNPFKSSLNLSFENKSSIILGAELEYNFPFSNKKWSVFIDPTLFFYKSNVNRTITNVASDLYSIDYKSLYIPIGIRHYLHLNNFNRLFLNTGVNHEFILKNELTYDYIINNNTYRILDYKIEPINSLFFGIGYEFNKKFNIEFRYNKTKKLIDSKILNSNFSNTTIKIGYNFL